MRSLAIVADDLTGGCDTGALFAGRGVVPLAIWPHGLGRAPVAVIDTESRGLDRREAAERVRAAAAGERTPLFKKIDSTVRGRVGAETEAAMSARGLSTALCCPAFPAQGRTVIDRVLRVHGIPVTSTSIAADPDFPRAARSLDPAVTLDALLAPQFEGPIRWLPLERVRAGSPALVEDLSRPDGGVVLAEAEDDADLDALAGAAMAATPPPLLVGSAGLARALARHMGLQADPVPLPSARRCLIVAGSRHPTTRRQVAAARRAGLTVLTAPDVERSDSNGVAKALAAEACATLAGDDPTVVVATGGETALALLEALGADGIDLVGPPRPGLALGHVRVPGRSTLPLVTKAGGFGSEDLLVSLAQEVEG